jgi:hypothetical protein
MAQSLGSAGLTPAPSAAAHTARMQEPLPPNENRFWDLVADWIIEAMQR